jgi:RNA polymerase sigma factor (sigma-70 family)
MADKSRIDFEEQDASGAGRLTRIDQLKTWFIEEVLPLEAVLIQFLSRGGRNRADVEDLRQELYTKVCAAARDELPHPTRPFVFTIARNVLIDRIRHEQVVAFDTVENLEDLNIAIDEPAPDRVVIARQELRRLQLALDKLPERFRTAIVMRKVDGLSLREIAQRTGLAEKTVEKHLTEGMRALAHILYRDAFDLRRPS